MLANMLDGDGQDQFDAGGWCFPKPIPAAQRNGDWIVRIRARERWRSGRSRHTSRAHALSVALST